MPEPTVDYQAVLADLKARRDQISQAIAVLESVAGAGGLGPSSGSGDTASIRSDSFFGMSVPQAVKKYLGMTGKVPKSPNDITETLKKGGQEQATYNNVYTALKRLPDVVKLPNGDWGLADWYGPSAKRKARVNDEDAADAPESNGDSGTTGDEGEVNLS